MIVAASAFTLLRGTPTYHGTVSDKGHHVSRGFCAACGSQLLGKVAEEPEKVIVQAGSLDDASSHRPLADIYCSRAEPWTVLDSMTVKAECSLTATQVADLMRAASL